MRSATKAAITRTSPSLTAARYVIVRPMQKLLLTTIAILLLPLATDARETERLYRWVDKNGNVHYGDKIPAEYAELEKQILNEHGVTVDTLRGKKTEEEKAEEARQERLAMEAELQKRADQALLATYMSIDEIVMHRDRRVELFQAQSRVTELYLKNLERRLGNLMLDASKFQPYSEDPKAPMIDTSLSADISTTKDTIVRHEGNLQRFKVDEKGIRKRFEADINRFKKLKGIDQHAAVTPPT